MTSPKNRRQIRDTALSLSVVSVCLSLPKNETMRKGIWLRKKKMELEKPHVPNTGVIPRLKRALEVIQPNEASCSSESSLSCLQMGQLGDDEKPWVRGPKLCLCIWLAFLWR